MFNQRIMKRSRGRPGTEARNNQYYCKHVFSGTRDSRLDMIEGLQVFSLYTVLRLLFPPHFHTHTCTSSAATHAPPPPPPPHPPTPPHTHTNTQRQILCRRIGDYSGIENMGRARARKCISTYAVEWTSGTLA